MKYRIALHKSEEGCSVSVPGLPGCWSQGATEQEAAKGSTGVLLSPKNAKAFPTSAAVNEALPGLPALSKRASRMTRR